MKKPTLFLLSILLLISIGFFYIKFKEYRNKSEVNIDTRVCIAQSDNRVKCLGRILETEGLYTYIFSIPFTVTTRADQWGIESLGCSILGYGSDNFQVRITVSDGYPGNCQVKLTFSANLKVTFDLLIP